MFSLTSLRAAIPISFSGLSKCGTWWFARYGKNINTLLITCRWVNVAIMRCFFCFKIDSACATFIHPSPSKVPFYAFRITVGCHRMREIFIESMYYRYRNDGRNLTFTLLHVTDWIEGNLNPFVRFGVRIVYKMYIVSRWNYYVSFF